MKRYRCPYCGEACVTWVQRVYGAGRWNRINGTFGTPCTSCHHLFVSRPRYSGPWLAALLFVELLPLIAFGLLAFLANSFMFCGFAIYLVLYTAVLLPMRAIFSMGLTQYDQKARKPVLPEPNVFLALESSGNRIDNLDIFGLRFENRTRNVGFREVFPDGLVPVVLYKDRRRDPGLCKAVLMNSASIPPDLLTEGAAFTIVDNDVIIAKGTIAKICGRPSSEQV